MDLANSTTTRRKRRVECCYLKSDVTDLPYFTSKVVFGEKNVEKVEKSDVTDLPYFASKVVFGEKKWRRSRQSDWKR